MTENVNSLYIHFPFCRHLCNYCDFFKHKLDDVNQVKNFQKVFKDQWSDNLALLTKHQKKMSELETLYIGGGTPSLWGAEGISFILDLMKDSGVAFKDDYEFTLEIDPGTCSEDQIDAWIKSGVNRFSVGVQTYSEKLLRVMDRNHSISDVEELLTILKNKKVNFSVDLMLGLPLSESREVEDEINKLAQFNPSHFSVYILKARKNYLHYKNLPDDESIREEYLRVCNYLESKKYHQYEVSNFSLRAAESKHNFCYWEYKDVAAVGANATGLIIKTDSALRYQWKSSSSQYQIEEIRGSSLIIEKLFLGLRTSKGITLLDLFEQKHHKELQKLYLSWQTQGYLSEQSSFERVRLSSLGYLMCDSLIDDIFKNIDF